MLVRCLYASRARTPQDEAVLESILLQARRKNGPLGITGLLCFTDGIFLQALEGGRQEVSGLLREILRDERHSDVEIIQFEEIAERRFAAWTMGRVNAAEVNAALILRYSKTTKFDPFSCSAAVTLTLLGEIAASGSVTFRPH
jgi:hypothetical protein